MPKGKSTKTKPPPSGPPREIITRIEYLANLLRHLPDTIPSNPTPTSYDFSLDSEQIEECNGSHFSALGHCLEIQFKTWKSRDGEVEVPFRERGAGLEGLERVLKDAVRSMSPNEREAFQSAWLERLIRGAKASGAKIPSVPKKRPAEAAPLSSPNPPKRPRNVESDVINVSDSNENDELADHSSSPPHPTLSSNTHDVHSPAISIPTGRFTNEVPLLPSHPNPRPQPKLAGPLTSRWTSSTGTKQITLSGWASKETEEAKRDRLARDATQLREKRLLEEAKKTERETTRAEQKREKTRLRVQRHRLKKRNKRNSDSSDESDEKDESDEEELECSNSVAAPMLHDHNVADLSRPESSKWRKKRDGTRGGVMENPTSKLPNYFHPLLWVWIEDAVVRCDYKATAAARAIHNDPRLHAMFPKLQKGRIQKWIVPGKKEFTSNVLENVARGKRLTKSGRTGLLDAYPDVKEEIMTVLKSYRTSGLSVMVPVVRATILAVIEERAPNILTENKFVCSDSYARSFVDSALGWSVRKGTRATKHIPENAEDLCEETFFRIAYTIRWDRVPAKLLINMDQQGMYVLPSNSYTFAETGSKQIDVIAKDEKRSFTVVVSSAADGSFLPFQAVWSGKTDRSLPKKNAPGMKEALSYGFHFTPAASETNPTSHFSTLKTMKEYIVKIVEPYRHSVIEADPDLDPDQKCILFIDIYPVHAGQAFRSFIFEDHPQVVLIFVPGNCTGIFQPADVGLQRIIKHQLKQELFMFMVEEQRKQVRQGMKPEDVKLATGLPQLRDASVKGMVKVYEFMQTDAGRSIVKKAWEKCRAKSYNLSYECLTSSQTCKDLGTYLARNHNLFKEIQDRMGVVHGVGDEEEREAEGDGNFGDDTDIPLNVVIQDAVGIDIGTSGHEETISYTSEASMIRNEGGVLQNRSEIESLLTYDESGQIYGFLRDGGVRDGQNEEKQ